MYLFITLLLLLLFVYYNNFLNLFVTNLLILRNSSGFVRDYTSVFNLGYFQNFRCFKSFAVGLQLECDGTRWRMGGEVKGKVANGVGSQVPFTLPRNMVCPALVPLICTPRLPLVDWTGAPADLNGLVHFAERRNLVSARVPSHFSWPLPLKSRKWTQQRKPNDSQQGQVFIVKSFLCIRTECGHSRTSAQLVACR